MTKSFVVRCLLREQLMKEGDTISFTYSNYELTMRREENLYAPFTIGLTGIGIFPTHKVNVGNRYYNAECAFLHILNRFNENVNIPNKYKSLDQWFDE